MGYVPIKLGNQIVHAHKAAIAPDFKASSVLTDSPWDFVEMWLKRNPVGDALFYWRQARQFHDASEVLSREAAPLTDYYCALNAAKALLTSRSISFSPEHGATGESVGSKTSLASEFVSFKTSGVLPALCRYLGEPDQEVRHSLKDIFYNLPYLHRAYTITYRTHAELFVPITRPIFVRKTGSSEAWFCCSVVDRRYMNQNTVDTINGYELDKGVKDAFVIRRQSRFRWERGGTQSNNLSRLQTYHKTVRKDLYYIRGISRLWYLKRDDNPIGFIPRSSLSLTYAAFHRLSELSRYTPQRLIRHFESQHNWLLSEFLNVALAQYIDEIAAEITGQDIMPTGFSNR